MKSWGAARGAGVTDVGPIRFCGHHEVGEIAERVERRRCFPRTAGFGWQECQVVVSG